MKQPPDALPDQNWTVSQVLSAYPQTAQVFFQLKTDCVGCILSRFCSIKDVAKDYNLGVDHIIDLLQQTAISSHQKE